eukprot:Stramenopile-MAST_4_protein_3321
MPKQKEGSAVKFKEAPPEHVVDMKRLNSLSAGYRTIMERRQAAHEKHLEQIEEKQRAICTFQPKINRNRKVSKRGKAVHDEEVRHQWAVVTEKEAKLLEEFAGNKAIVPLSVDAGDVVKVIQKRLGSQKYFCHVSIGDTEGVIPMHCLSKFSGFTRLYENGREERLARDAKHASERSKREQEGCTFRPQLVTRKNADGRYWLSKVGAPAMPPEKVLPSGRLRRSPEKFHAPSGPLKAPFVTPNRPRQKGPISSSPRPLATFHPNQHTNKGTASRRRPLRQAGLVNDASDGSYRYGVDKTIALPYWDERNVVAQNVQDNITDFTQALERIASPNRRPFPEQQTHSSTKDFGVSARELKRIELLTSLEAELLRTELSAATSEITNELKNLRFELEQKHQEVLASTPAAITSNILSNPHKVRAARKNLRLLKSKSKSSPSQGKRQIVVNADATFPAAVAVTYDGENGRDSFPPMKASVAPPRESGILEALAVQERGVKKFRSNTLKSLNTRFSAK